MDTILPETALILVAIVPSQRDFNIARLLGWYRIPLKSAPKVISVDYLALYQTAAFDKGDRWHIAYIAPVIGHELTTRRELLQEECNHPRAHEEYFKIQLGPLRRLPKPIPAKKWRRITFFYTTGKQFSDAQCLNDLIVRSEERNVLWRSLRERALKANEYKAEQLPEIPIDPAILELLGFMRRN